MELEESGSLTSDYSAKLQPSKQYTTETKAEMHTDQRNSVESPEINPCSCGQSIYDKNGKNTQWRKDSLLN